MLYLAAILFFLIGVAHSCLGERYILMRLFKREDLPKLFGGTEFTTGTLRFAWHITTVAWWGFAAMLALAQRNQINERNVLMTIATVAIVSALLPVVFTKAQHLSWVVFLAIAALIFFSGSF